MEYISERTNILQSSPQTIRTNHQPVVYYVEDNDMARKCTEELIRSWGYDVIPKRNPGKISFDIYLDSIDAFVLDFEIRGFRPEHYLPYIEKSGIPIIFYSGHDEDYIRGFLEGSGYSLSREVFCITKPKTKDLMTLLENVTHKNQKKVAL